MNMDFDFQKSKTPQFLLDELMASRPKNYNDSRASGLSGFDVQNGEMSNSHMEESNGFHGLTDFHPPQTSSQISQFMFDQGSPRSSDDSFGVSHNHANEKDDAEKAQNDKKKSFQHIDSFFYAEGSPQNPPSPHSDNHPPGFNHEMFSYENTNIAVDEENNHDSAEKVNNPENTSVPDNHKPKEDERGSEDKEQEVNPLQSKVSNVSCSMIREEIFSSLVPEINQFSKSFTKLSIEKTALEKKIVSLENSLKEYRDQASNYRNMYEEMKGKWDDEIRNRELVLSQAEYISNVCQVIEKHYKDVTNTLTLYTQINMEHKEYRKNLEEHVTKTLDENESTMAEYKNTIDELLSREGKKVNELQENIKNLLKIKEELIERNEEIEKERQLELCKCANLEKCILTMEQQNKEIAQKMEMSEKFSSEKYSLLESIYGDSKTKMESLQKELLELKIYEVKYNQLEEAVSKLQEEKQALSNILDTAHQNLSKSEGERSELQKCFENIYAEKEKINNSFTKLKEEYADLQLKLNDTSFSFDMSLNEMKELKTKYETVCEEFQTIKILKLRLEDDIKKSYQQNVSLEKVLFEEKSQRNALQTELEVMKAEITSKTEKILCMEERLSLCQTKNKELHQNENQLKNIISEETQKLNDLMNLKTYLEEELKKQCEVNEELKAEISVMKIQTVKAREEMLRNVDQYREQFMNELKENEGKHKHLEQKYETALSDKEKVMEEKKISEAKISSLQNDITEYESKLTEMIKITKEVKEEQEKKEKDYFDETFKLKNQIIKLEEEKEALQSSIQDLKNDSIINKMTKEKAVSLEKEVEKLRKENEEIKEKLQKREQTTQNPRQTISQKDTHKFTESLPSTRKRPSLDGLDEDFMSDASSIDLQNFFETNKRKPALTGERPTSTNNNEDGKSKSRRPQKNVRNATSTKKFFKNTYNDTNIFG